MSINIMTKLWRYAVIGEQHYINSLTLIFLKEEAMNIHQFKNQLLYLVCLVFPSVVFAGGETPVSDGLHYITNAMYGATGIAIATISVMVVGLVVSRSFS